MPVVDAKGKTFLTPVRASMWKSMNSSIRQVLLNAADGPRHQDIVHRWFLPGSGRAEPQPGDRRTLWAADAEFSNNACEGARTNAKKYGFKIAYDKTYPPSTTDFTPIVRAVQAANPDIVVVCSYPLDLGSACLKAINEVGHKPKMLGGAMVGLQATAFKNQLGPLLNGIVNYETWVPDKKLTFAGTDDFFKKYQARAAAEGVDPLGYYLGRLGLCRSSGHR